MKYYFLPCTQLPVYTHYNMYKYVMWKRLYLNLDTTDRQSIKQNM
jgi:hypothetical protein